MRQDLVAVRRAVQKVSVTGGIKHLARHLVEEVSRFFFNRRTAMTHRLWGIEGVNRLLRDCRPVHVADLLKRFGATVGQDADLYAPLAIHNAYGSYANLKIGHHCHLGKDLFLDLCDTIEIEDLVTISMRVTILTHMDVGHSPVRSLGFPTQKAPVRLERGAYVGAGATILQGVTVGECAVIGAGAVVIADVPPYSVVVGVPARVVKTLRADRASKEGAEFDVHS